MKTAIPTLLIAAICTLSACNPLDKSVNGSIPEQTEGWVPIYKLAEEVNTVKSEPAKPMENGGKIYLKDNILYQVEVGKGVHVTDITDPANPVRKYFLTVVGAQEMAIMGTYLYVNNLNNLVVINIADPANAKLVKQMPDVFHLLEQNVPPETGYFECVDAAKGVVVGWERKTIKRPKCIRN